MNKKSINNGQVGAILTYRNDVSGGVCGQTAGAEGGGEYAVVFIGSVLDSENAAIEYTKMLLKKATKSRQICNIMIVTAIETFSGCPIKVIRTGNKGKKCQPKSIKKG